MDGPPFGASRFMIVGKWRATTTPVDQDHGPGVAAGYVASLASHYQAETTRPWDDVVEDVRRDVQAVIDRQGSFITAGDLAAFVCR